MAKGAKAATRMKIIVASVLGCVVTLAIVVAVIGGGVSGLAGVPERFR